MREITVLLTREDPSLSRALEELLEHCRDIRLAEPGEDVPDLREQVRRSHAQVLVMVLRDAAPDPALLQALQGTQTEVLVCSSLCSPALARRLGELGVAQLISLPCTPQALAEHIRLAAAGETPGRCPEDYPERRVGQLLQRMGLSPVRKSYRYLCRAVCLRLWEGEDCAGVTKWIYPRVGKDFGVNSTAVERSVRQAIRRLWSRPLTPLQRQLFPADALMGREFPTNTQFICTLARFLLETWGEMAM